ncbi:MAG: hypothetical protein WC565_03330 [Parcubacteria group bacterium]|jgi:hypothetical protein
MSEQVLIVPSLSPGCGGQDSGNQGYLTASAMRRHLGWDARSVVFFENYLRYDTDFVIGRNATPQSVLDYAKDCSFFVFMDGYVDEQYLPMRQFLTPTNHCIVGVGSALRRNVHHTLMDQITLGTKVVVPPQDESLCTTLCGVPFDFVIVDIEEIESLAREKNDEFTVCYAHTHSMLKGDDIIGRLKQDLPYIKFEEIRNMPWRKAIEAKSRCHVVLDDFVLPTYGLNVLEAGILGQHVISRIGPWVYMIYPDFPFASVDPNCADIYDSMYDAAYDQLIALNDAPEMWEQRLGTANQWVHDHHSSNAVANKWRWFLKWMKSQ